MSTAAPPAMPVMSTDRVAAYTPPTPARTPLASANSPPRRARRAVGGEEDSCLAGSTADPLLQRHRPNIGAITATGPRRTQIVSLAVCAASNIAEPGPRRASSAAGLHVRKRAGPTVSDPLALYVLESREPGPVTCVVIHGPSCGLPCTGRRPSGTTSAAARLLHVQPSHIRPEAMLMRRAPRCGGVRCTRTGQPTARAVTPASAAWRCGSRMPARSRGRR